MPREMKESGVDWIGVIPKNWGTSIVRNCLVEINDSNNPIKTTNVLSLTNKLGVVPYEEKGNQGNKSKENYSGYKLAYENTIVANSMNVLIGSVGISNYYGCVSPVYYVFKAKDNVDLRYINYLFQNAGFQKELRKYAKGIMEIRLRVSSRDIMHRTIPLPNRSMQKSISDYLDKECKRIDRVITDTERSIEEYKKLKQSIITEAVTKGVRGHNREMKDSDIKWIGQIPKEWRVDKIKYVSEIGPNCKNVSDDSVVTYTPMENIKSGYFIDNAVPKHKVPASLTPYEEGDIVLAKVTPCFENMNIAIMNSLSSGVGYGSSELFVLRPKKVDTDYLFYWLQNYYFMDMGVATMTGVGGLKRVSPYYVKNSFILLPPKTEQREIAGYLKKRIRSLDDAVRLKERFAKELEDYKKSIIYEYVTGKKEVPEQ